MKRSWLWCAPVFVVCACGPKQGGDGTCPSPAEGSAPQAVTETPADGGVPAPITPGPLPDACAPLSGAAERGWPPLQTSVPVYELSLSEANLAALDAHVADRSFTVPGRFTFDGRAWDVTVRYRGRHTRYLPKKSFQIRFPDADKFFGGVGRLELLAEYKDGGMLTEKLWYDLAYAVNLEVPSTRYVELHLNGRLYGVMLEVEAITRPFLRAHGFNDDADLYRCGMFDCELRELPGESYQEPWEKRTNEDQSWDPLWALMQGLQRTSPNDFAAFVEAQLDLDAYLTWLAVDAAIGNDTIGDSRSYLVREPDGRWTYVPWDLNNAVSLYNRLNGHDQWPNSSRPLKDFTVYDPRAYTLAARRKGSGDPYFATMKPAWSNLNTRILDDPGLRQRLADKLEALLQTRFREEELGPRADALEAFLAPYLQKDPYIDPYLRQTSAEFLRNYVRLRGDYLRAHLGDLREHGKTALRIVRAGLTGGGSPFIDVANTGSSAVALGGMRVTGWLRVPHQASVPARTLQAGEVVRLEPGKLTPVEGGFTVDRARPEFGLFDAAGTEAVDVVYLPPLVNGQSWSRTTPTAERWQEVGP